MKLSSLRLCHLGLALLASVALNAGAATQVLYDANVGTLPKAQGWLDAGMVFDSESLTTSPNATLVQPTVPSNSTYGGYSNHYAIPVLTGEILTTGAMVNNAFPTLDRNAGYALTLSFQVLSESHATADRGGFSITLIGSDKTGIAIGFQDGKIFAHNGDSTLTAGENVTTSTLVNRAFASNTWQVSVLGNNYVLSQGADQILTGSLRDYANGGYNGPGNSAYKTENFLFFGDNTSSARASFAISYAAITSAVPEPSTYGMLAAGLALVSAVVQRRRRTRA